MTFTFHPTIRAIITFLFLVYLCSTVAIGEFDVLATYIVLGLGMILFVLGMWVLWRGRRLTHQLQISLFPAFASLNQIQGQVYSGTPATIQFNTGISAVAPGTSLYLEFLFHEASSFFISTLLVSSADLGTSQQISVVFPHRGVWLPTECNWEIKDSFGFWSYQGRHGILQAQPSAVYPLLPIRSDFPTMFSSLREGDTTFSDQQPSGDPYDIKRYNPSDGLRKVVWKVFARTGELLSRHPEQTMTPEGRIVLFVAGGTKSDGAYAAAHHYFERMRAQGLEVIATGANFGSTIVQNDADLFLQNCLTTAFEPSSSESLIHLIKSCSTTNAVTHVAVVFSLEEDPHETIKCVEEAIGILEQNSITPMLMSAHPWHPFEEPPRSSRLKNILFDHQGRTSVREKQEVSLFKRKIIDRVGTTTL